MLLGFSARDNYVQLVEFVCPRPWKLFDQIYLKMTPICRCIGWRFWVRFSFDLKRDLVNVRIFGPKVWDRTQIQSHSDWSIWLCHLSSSFYIALECAIKWTITTTLFRWVSVVIFLGRSFIKSLTSLLLMRLDIAIRLFKLWRRQNVRWALQWVAVFNHV